MSADPRENETVSNMEFNFQSASHSSIQETKIESLSEPSTSPYPEIKNPHPQHRISISHSHPQNPKNMSNTPFSQYQQNVQRQRHEQHAVGSILSGVAITLIAAIILVAFLAGYGGWVLSRQIKEQNVTLNDLAKKNERTFALLNEDLKSAEKAIDELTATDQALKQRVSTLQTQLDQLLSQIRKERSADQFRLQKLENRIYDLERNGTSIR